MLLMVASCAKQQPVDLHDEFDELNEAFTAYYDSVVTNCTHEEAVALLEPRYEEFFGQMHDLLDEHMGEPFSDTLFAEMMPYFTPEQQENLVGKVTEEMKQNPIVRDCLAVYELQKKTSEGQPFTEISSPDKTGELHFVSEMIGKTDYVLIDFWASWCGPCRRLLPKLKELYAEFQPQGKLEIVGVSVDTDEEAWLQALDDEQLPWLNIHDVRLDPHNPSEQYGVQSIPCTVLIDKNGVIVARDADEEQIRQIIENN